MTQDVPSAGGEGERMQLCDAAKTRYRGRSVYQREKRTVVEDVNGVASEAVGASARSFGFQGAA